MLRSIWSKCALPQKFGVSPWKKNLHLFFKTFKSPQIATPKSLCFTDSQLGKTPCSKIISPKSTFISTISNDSNLLKCGHATATSTLRSSSTTTTQSFETCQPLPTTLDEACEQFLRFGTLCSTLN